MESLRRPREILGSARAWGSAGGLWRGGNGGGWEVGAEGGESAGPPRDGEAGLRASLRTPRRSAQLRQELLQLGLRGHRGSAVGSPRPARSPAPARRSALRGSARGAGGRRGGGRREKGFPTRELTGCGGHSPREPGNFKPCLGALQPLWEQLPRDGMFEGCGIFGRIPRALRGLTGRFSVTFKFSEVTSCL